MESTNTNTMNLQQVKDAIVIKEYPNFSETRTMFVAELVLSRSAFATEEILQQAPNIAQKIGADLVEGILRDLYEDRRRVMSEALTFAFRNLRASPFEGSNKLLQVRDKLIDAAGRSVPNDNTPASQLTALLVN